MLYVQIKKSVVMLVIVGLSSVQLYAKDFVDIQFNSTKIKNGATLPTCTNSSLSACTINIDDAFGLVNDSIFKRNLRENNIKTVSILFRPQKYYLTQTYHVTWQADTTLILQGTQTKNARTILSGAEKIKFEPLSKDQQLLFGLNQAYKDNIRVANLSDILEPKEGGFSEVIQPIQGELFWQDKVQTLSQWPNTGFATINSIDKKNGKEFKIQNFNLPKTQLDNLQAQGYWFWDWSNQNYNMTYLGNGVFFRKNGNIRYGVKDNQRVVLKNAMIFLDKPGEWYADPKQKKVYFWLPNKNIPQAEWSRVNTLLKINLSRNVQINDIDFTQTRGDAIVVNQSNDVVLKGIKVDYTGNTAVVINGGKRSGIISSVIQNTGEGGVILNGGNRKSLEPSKHFVKNSTIINYDRLIPTYRPAISLNGVGQIAQGNQISQGAHAAIIFVGNDHYIADNHISKVALTTSDVGAIYTGRDYTARGTIIENNILQDIQPFRPDGVVVGVYLDDQASGIIIRNNQFINIQRGILLGGGRDNQIINNTFNNNKIAIYYDARGITWQKDNTQDEKWQLKTGLRAVPYQSKIWKKKYPNLANILQDDYGHPKYNKILNNSFTQSLPIKFISMGEGENGVEVQHK